MKKYILHFVFAILLFVQFGCKENSTPTNSTNGTQSAIDSKIYLNIHEELNSTNRNVVLLCNTEKHYSPAGSRILSSITRKDKLITIVFSGLLISDCGAAITTPAFTEFNLNTLEPGSYTLDIFINGKALTGLLTVSDDSFQLQLPPNNIVEVNNDILYRIPQSIIWGQAESKDQSSYQQFLDSLVVLGAKPHNLKPGDYHYFEVDAQGDFNTHSVMDMSYGKFFLYNFEGDTLLTRNLIKGFAKKYMDSINIQLTGGRGEMYHSTVLKNEP